MVDLNCGQKVLLWKIFPPKKQVALVEVSPRIMVARFQDPLQVVLLKEHNWSLKVSGFWGSK